MGIRVPEQLAIVGFDNLDLAEYADLTTVNQHLDESGKIAVEVLLNSIANPHRPIQHINLPLTIIERETA
jgi:LacI family transcriptional regulator